MNTPDFDDFKKQLGQALKARRRLCGLSQEQAGEALGMDRVSIGYIEQGKRAPRLSTLYALVQLYDISLADLFSFSQNEDK